jgi:hypothetical protein
MLIFLSKRINKIKISLKKRLKKLKKKITKIVNMFVVSIVEINVHGKS